MRISKALFHFINKGYCARNGLSECTVIYIDYRSQSYEEFDKYINSIKYKNLIIIVSMPDWMYTIKKLVWKAPHIVNLQDISELFELGIGNLKHIAIFRRKRKLIVIDNLVDYLNYNKIV